MTDKDKLILITRFKEIQTISDTQLKESRLQVLLDDLKQVVANVEVNQGSKSESFPTGFYKQVKAELNK